MPGELEHLLRGNEEFRKEMGRGKLTKIAQEHAPKAVIITCSDARMSPEYIFKAALGDLFVVRNAGNTIMDPSALGSIEYAVEHLNTKLVLILGHYGCGAVEAAFGPPPTDFIAMTIQYLQYAKTMAEMSDLPDKKKATVLENVKYQVEELKTRSQIVARKLQQGQLNIVGAIYNMEDGTIEVLK